MWHINELFSDLDFNVEQEMDRVDKPEDYMDFANGFDDDGDKEEFDESDDKGGETRMMRSLLMIWLKMVPLLVLPMITMRWKK